MWRNQELVRTELPPAVITGAYQTGVLGVRTLARHGVRAVCVDCDSTMPGFRSKYGPARLCPNPDREPERWVAYMCSLADEMGQRPALIHSADRFVTAAGAYASALRQHYFMPDAMEIQQLLANKPSQYDLAARYGMRLPRSRTVTSVEEVEQFSRECSFPCLLKPVHFREWQSFPPAHPLCHRKILIGQSPEDLVRGWRLAAQANPTVILQEIIDGSDDAKRVYLAVYDGRGQKIGGLVLKELRCEPVGFGPASVTEPVVDAEVEDVCDRFLRDIGYVGICEIELKRDSTDGLVKLIEANPRLSGSGDAANYAGVELCWLHYQDLIGRSVDPVVASAKHFSHIVLRADASAAVEYWRRGLVTTIGVVKPYFGRCHFFDLDWGDWRYSLETIAVATKAFVTGLVRPLSH